MADEKPQEKPTVPFEAPPAWAIEMAQKQAAGFENVNKRLDTIETNVDLQAATVRDLQQRVTRTEEKQDKSSLPVKVDRVTQNDGKQDLALAALSTKVDVLATEVETVKTDVGTVKSETTAQTAMLAKITGLLDTPMAKRIGQAVGILVLTAIGAATAYVAGRNQAPVAPVHTLPAVTP